MAKVIHKINVEVSKPNFFQAIVAKQYDSKSRWLRVTLVDNGEKITVADSSSVTINARRSDGGEKKFPGSVDRGQGTVLVPLAYWMLELEGTVKSDVTVTDTSGSILTTTSFTIEVERASCQSGDVSPDDANVDVLTGLILEVQNIKENYNVEQTYNPSSTHAQSGVAIAQALENVEIDVDDEMSDTSTNPVGNKVIKEYVDKVMQNVDITDDLEKVMATHLPTYDTNATLTTGAYVNYTNGKFYDFEGNLNALEIDLHGVTKINYLFTNIQYSVAGLAFMNASGNYISGIQPQSNIQTVDVPEGAVTCRATVDTIKDVSLDYSLASLLEKNKELEDCIKDALSENLELKVGYIDGRNGKFDGNANFTYVEINDVIGEQILYTTAPMSGGAIAGIGFYNEYDVCLASSLIASTPQILNIPKGTTCIKATVKSVDEVKRIFDIDTVVDCAEKQKSFSVLGAFNNILCIGDSLTFSQVYYDINPSDDKGISRKAYNTYPELLAKRTGTEVTSFAETGYSALKWWEKYVEGKFGDIIQKENQLAIIYLGTNAGLTDTLDTDAPSGTDYNNWASTNTGCYAKIIAKCQEVGCKIILVQCFYTSGGTNANTVITNNVIDKMADRFKCGVVPPIYLKEKALHCFPDGREHGSDTAVHYNDLGYSAFTDALIHEIGNMPSEYMQNIIPN